MKTRIVLTILAAALVPACGGTEAGGGGNGAEMEVAAGFYPLAYAAEEIGGEGVEVTNLTPEGAEPHDVELSVRDVETVAGADLVLYLGGGFQPALEEAVESTDADGLDLLEGIDVRREDGAVDPHVWLDPLRFAAVAERIGTELGREERASELASRLRALDDEYRNGLARCERRELVTAHDAFGYLGERFELEVLPIAGISPEAEPTPQDLERVTELVRARGVTTVFVEPLLSPEVGETVARETGAEVALLNPLEGLTEDELERGEDYFSVMRRNLAALRKGLGCS